VNAGRRQLVLRVAPPRDSVFVFYERDMMRQEPRIHRLLRENTSVPVAGIIALDTSHNLIDRDFILMERLPGRALSDTPAVDTSRTFAQVGEALAQTHALTAEHYGYLGEHHPMKPQPSWAEAFRVMWGKLVADVAAVGYYNRAEQAQLAGLLDEYLPLFDRPVPASLLHMDVWAQNILVDEHGNLTGLVDWDRALWGDPEIEFAVLDYCGVSVPSFWEGYGKTRERSPEERVRNIFYLLYEIQKYIVIRHGRNRDPATASSYRRQVAHIIEQSFGRLG
jgi:aminoglycoside phosphotransferase (APT) family kinase protein